jgi:hypothetical protein
MKAILRMLVVSSVFIVGSGVLAGVYGGDRTRFLTDSVQALANEGYNEIEIVDAHVFKCRSGFYQEGFTATKDGKRFNGVVCGNFGGNSSVVIRYEEWSKIFVRSTVGALLGARDRMEPIEKLLPIKK